MLKLSSAGRIITKQVSTLVFPSILFSIVTVSRLSSAPRHPKLRPRSHKREREREAFKPIGQAAKPQSAKKKKRRRIRRTWSKRIYIKATGAQLRDVISFLNIRRDSCVCHKSSARETTDKNIRARHKRTTSKTNTVLSLIHVINWIH